ncbi:hypothetical protein [Candidatus Nephthysia bennettiae]|uniref:Uncharacterized protein n=1 Tax=Candidatus Nephthysia bennettiae TaxID=3127016 RepID=A0A934K4F9_9BACT|nr:hypothetical protein [Candidatus Dormibacteraeota bacterium]
MNGLSRRQRTARETSGGLSPWTPDGGMLRPTERSLEDVFLKVTAEAA